MVCVNSPCSSTSKLLKSLNNSEKGVTSRRQSKNYRQCNSQRKWTKRQTRKTPTKQYTENWIGQPKPHPPKSRDECMCYGRTGSSCFTSYTRLVFLV